MANEGNIEGYKIRSTSEAREKGRKGGIASGKSRRENNKKIVEKVYERLRVMGAKVLSRRLKKIPDKKKLQALFDDEDIDWENLTFEESGLFHLAVAFARGEKWALLLWYEVSGEKMQNVNLSGEIEVKRDLSRLDDREMAVLAGLVAKTNTDDP